MDAEDYCPGAEDEVLGAEVHRQVVLRAWSQLQLDHQAVPQHVMRIVCRSPKSYRCYIEAVNNQNVNDIIDFLRYECNVQIEKLNRDQKRSMRTQLTKIREWLGNRDLAQLETYYRFIHRHYNKSIEIAYEDAIKIYKTIIQIIKSPYVNVLEIDEG